MLKIFADKQGQAIFVCPHCGFSTSFDASAYRERDSRITIKCRCGKKLALLVEFRKFYRRAVSLLGQCENHRTKESLDIRLHDLSMSGLSFSVASIREVETPPFQVGDVLTVQFRLDYPPRDLIQRRAEVRNMRGDVIGVQFFRSEYDKELGFYLLR
jgi:hypothetical protein